jgi:hypothetical protein
MRYVAFLFLVLIFGTIGAQELNNPNKLKLCPNGQNARYHNCWGTYTGAEGDKYVGEYKDDKRNGQGTYYYLADNQWKGDKYVGEFKDDKFHGQGTYTYANGEKYVGEFKDDKSHGQGTHTWANGDKYVGEFKDDKKHGQGTYTWANGEKYVGEFKDDKSNGIGTYYYLADNQWKGDKYVGEFKDWARHGQGIYISKDGTRTEGIFENDNFVREAKVNLPNLNNKVASSADRTDIQRERQQQAENNNLDQGNSVTDSRRRFALVIGNSTYSTLPRLPNAINDARVITQSLRSAGFQVSTHENLDLAGMQNAIRVFGEKLGKSDVGLVYYAGHGVQVKGKNYLIPVKENIKKSFEVPSSAVDVDLVLATLENIKNDLNIVVLDACRSSFPGEARGTNRGLATIEAAKGTFIAFATAPGKEALDGSGSNSPYTKHLAKLIGKKGLPLEQVFKEVRKAVVAETNGEQVPWENSSLMGDFYFQK